MRTEGVTMISLDECCASLVYDKRDPYLRVQSRYVSQHCAEDPDSLPSEIVANVEHSGWGISRAWWSFSKGGDLDPVRNNPAP